MINTFHLGLKFKDCRNITLAILPGDPARVKKIALLLDNPQYISSCREFVIWSAELDSNRIIICSTGIGGSSTSIVVEELSQLGIRTFLRIGTAGSIQSYVEVGNVLVITAAVRCDGASQHYAPLEFPASADVLCSIALMQAADAIGVKMHFGVSVSSDTFYPGQERLNTYSGRIIKSLRGSMEEWRSMGVIGYEMESATLLTMCLSQGLKAGSVVGIVVNRIRKEIPNFSSIQFAEDSAIKVGIAGARILLKNNNLYV